MNWDDVRFFIEVVKCGTVSAAAVELGVSHATVLRRIQQFEHDLDTRLFDHLQSGYKPTAAGKEIYSAALSMEIGAETLQHRLTAKETEPEGVLRLGVPDHELLNLSGFIHQFCEAYPKITINAVFNDSERKLARFEIDAAIAICNTPADDLVGRQLGQLSFAYYRANSEKSDSDVKGRTKHNAVQSAGQVRLNTAKQGWAMWHPDAQSALQQRFKLQEQWLQSVVEDPRVVFRTQHYGQFMSALRAGLGVGLARKRVYSDLEELDFPDKVGKFGVWVLSHPELRDSARVKAFVKFAAEHLDMDNQ